MLILIFTTLWSFIIWCLYIVIYEFYDGEDSSNDDKDIDVDDLL